MAKGLPACDWLARPPGPLITFVFCRGVLWTMENEMTSSCGPRLGYEGSAPDVFFQNPCPLGSQTFFVRDQLYPVYYCTFSRTHSCHCFVCSLARRLLLCHLWFVFDACFRILNRTRMANGDDDGDYVFVHFWILCNCPCCRGCRKVVCKEGVDS